MIDLIGSLSTIIYLEIVLDKINVWDINGYFDDIQDDIQYK